MRGWCHGDVECVTADGLVWRCPRVEGYRVEPYYPRHTKIILEREGLQALFHLLWFLRFCTQEQLYDAKYT
jgi:hypothetical protein